MLGYEQFNLDMSDKVIPVIIIGGGACGLALSNFLSNYGVEHVLFERRDNVNGLPKAHYLNQRTMEIFRLHGMPQVRELSCPPRQMSYATCVTSLGGQDELDRTTIHRIACFGGDDGSAKAQAYVNDSAERSGNVPQSRLEPLLRELALQKGPASLKFKHTVVDLIDQGDTVLVSVENDRGILSHHRARYVVGADGGHLVGAKIGVEMKGPTGITEMVAVHFEADLSEYWDDRVFLCYFINGNGGTIFESGAIVPHGPVWGKHCREWVFHFGFDLNDEARNQEERLLARIRETLKIPELEIGVKRISHWIIESVVAERYRKQNIFLAGDAAHRRPPNGGLGLNTAIEDAANLSWKLAMVLRYGVDPKILDSYDSERRPIGKRNSDWGLFAFENSAVINSAVGLMTGQKELNKARFRRLFEQTHVGAARRAQVRKMIETQYVEFGAHGLELGFSYDMGLKVDDGTEMPVSDALGQQYVPTTRPGHRLPHAWLEQDDCVLSTHDLVSGEAKLLLITDEDGGDWIEAAERVSASLKVPLAVSTIGFKSGIRDYDNRWETLKEIGPGGALLIRPDNFVAWRAKRPSNSKGGELEDVLFALLGDSRNN